LCASAIAGASFATAEPAGLSGEEISRLIAGASIEIDAPLGNKIPVSFTADGRVTGSARDLASYLGSPTDKGRWWVASDQLCHKWSRWFSSETQCLSLKREGTKFRWRDLNGQSGTARVTVPAPVQIAVATTPPPPQLEGRMRLAAPPPMPTASNSIMPQAPSETPAIAIKPSKPVATKNAPVQQPVTALVQPTRTPSISATVALTPAQPIQKAFMVANVDSDDVLNVRQGPSTEYDVVAELKPGTRGVTMTGACQSEWCPVEHQTRTGWVNRMYLTSETMSRDDKLPLVPVSQRSVTDYSRDRGARDSSDAPRSCLSSSVRALLERVEAKFGRVQTISTCRAGATIAGSGRPSRHASGNAVDFNAGSRKGEIIEWLIANHQDGGTMTYPNMDHVHIDIGPHFVSIAGGRHWASWRNNGREAPGRRGS
jgi:uncharacterized protein YcbK (DUF882 family)